MTSPDQTPLDVLNPSAFPFQREHPIRGGGSYRDDHPGMTLRDWFAGQVVTGLLASEAGIPPYSSEWAAERAYLIADAMLAARLESEEAQ